MATEPLSTATAEHERAEDARAWRLVLQLITEKVDEASRAGIPLSGFAHDIYGRCTRLVTIQLNLLAPDVTGAPPSPYSPRAQTILEEIIPAPTKPPV